MWKVGYLRQVIKQGLGGPRLMLIMPFTVSLTAGHTHLFLPLGEHIADVITSMETLCNLNLNHCHTHSLILTENLKFETWNLNWKVPSCGNQLFVLTWSVSSHIVCLMPVLQLWYDKDMSKQLRAFQITHGNQQSVSHPVINLNNYLLIFILVKKTTKRTTLLYCSAIRAPPFKSVGQQL